MDTNRWLALRSIGGRGRIFWATSDYVSPCAEVTKEEFIGSAATLYLIGIVPVFATLVLEGVLGRAELVLSVIGMVLILGAVAFGRWLREKVAQEAFRKAL